MIAGIFLELWRHSRAGTAFNADKVRRERIMILTIHGQSFALSVTGTRMTRSKAGKWLTASTERRGRQPADSRRSARLAQ